MTKFFTKAERKEIRQIENLIMEEIDHIAAGQAKIRELSSHLDGIINTAKLRHSDLKDRLITVDDRARQASDSLFEATTYINELLRAAKEG